jgi:DUF4097 and DUF4098 domain-containing protein YvlB
MQKNCRLMSTIALVACPLLAFSGCEIPSAKYKRTLQLSAPLSAGSTFELQTHNGYVTVNGRDENGCSLTATVTARAPTEENAKEIAEKTRVSLKSSADTLTVEIDKPTLASSQSVSVSLDVNVPNETDLLLSTHNGAVTLANVKGSVNAATHNGKVTASHVSGQARLKTYNGAVLCEEISGDTWLSAHNGGIKAFYAADAPAVCEMSLTTYNGGIELKTPPDLSAAVELSTHNGSIKTDLPISVTGTVSKNKLQGKIGDGLGKLKLVTHNGSIRIR